MTNRLEPEFYIPFAERLANVSGEIVRRYYRKDIDSETKGDMTPVTLADKEIETNLRAMIRNAYPDHGIIGEEFEPLNSDSDYKWLIDPIDGTKSFIIGRPIFGTLISLVHKTIPILGIIDQPVIGERWIGVMGYATNFNNNQVRTRNCSSLSEAILSTTSPNLFRGSDFDKFEKVRQKAKFVVYGGDCYSYGLLANGFIDVVLEMDLKPYDFCALAPIITGAHGIITDWSGNKINEKSDGKILACGDKRIHEEILRILTYN